MRLNLATAVTAVLVPAIAAAPQPATECAPGPAANINKFAVGTLPEVYFTVPKSWAGQIPIGDGYGNDTLFFWLWQAENRLASEDLIIWLQGGPACSSLTGLFKENGPLNFPNYATKPQANPYTWTKLANILYVDQPVGTGFSDGDQLPNDFADYEPAFVQWLDKFFDTFTALKAKRIHLMGESYAGVYIPYFAQAIEQQKATLGFHLTSIGIGDGTWGNPAAQTDGVAYPFLKAHLGAQGDIIPADILAVLKKADEDCGFVELRSHVTYPPKGKFYVAGDPENNNYKRDSTTSPPGYDPKYCDFTNGTHTAAQVSFLINGTQAPQCFGSCATYDVAQIYFYDNIPGWNGYNVNDNYNRDGLYYDDAWVNYVNEPALKAAIHAPGVDTYSECNTVLENTLNTEHVTPPAYTVIPGLLAAGVEINLYGGDLDYIISSIGQELEIQNMTWCGQQGLSSPPTKPFDAADGTPAGTYGVERGLSFYNFYNAGHRVPQDAPAAAFAFVQKQVVKHL